MSFIISDVYAGARALLNDQNDNIFHNEVQFEYLKIAYDELRQELESNNIPISNRTSDIIEISAGVTDIGGPTGPPLPLDFIDPLDLNERTTNTDNSYALMIRLQFLPLSEVRTMYLGYWIYQDGMIKLLGATDDIDIKMNYIGDPLYGLIDEYTQVRVANSINALKYRVAALCARFIGENPDRANELDTFAINSLATLVSIPVKSAQSIITRRRPRAGTMYGRRSWGDNW